MAKKLMIQGTMSGVGKSALTAGFLRLFAREGLKCAPFKSQNMALNSGVTADGLEMGRAQIMQARAARTEPDVRMNPILLKPEGDRKSQVVFRGQAIGSYSSTEYFAKRGDFLPDVVSCFESLSAENDVIVIEGAGSPAEINLNVKHNDIVNMGLAEAVDAPVLIAADIDRGGAFAQCLGTYEWLRPEEKARVKGFLFNKFRGDPSLLVPGPEMLLERTGVPLLGVVPYADIDLDDEDFLAERLQLKEGAGTALLDIAVIRLPHISNFTDFIPLTISGISSVRYVERAEDLGEPDLIILPGTKTTMDDLRWLKGRGLAEKIRGFAAAGGQVFGLCGGYQMLGETLSDPAGNDGGGEEEGLGLLHTKTFFSAEKTLQQCRGFFGDPADGPEISGYQIHAGVTEGTDLPMNYLVPADGKISEQGLKESPGTVPGNRVPEGAVSGNICGTYIHGIFDTADFLRTFLKELAEANGKSLPADIPIESRREREEKDFDLLADTLEEHVDMKAIRCLMGL